MSEIDGIKETISTNGFVVVEDVFSEKEIENLLTTISAADTSGPAFRKSDDLFAIRRFFKEISSAFNPVFNTALLTLVTEVFGQEFFVVKSIYFDKPGNSNWFVAYHQDLTISVNKKAEAEGYGPWTAKGEQYAVQPPVGLLQDNFTIRIHLDKTTADNGALKVIPGSHLKGIYRPETINWQLEKENVCSVGKGGVMLMKPLLLHSSSRTINHDKRRVIHIEFSRSALPDSLHWAEKLNLPFLTAF